MASRPDLKLPFKGLAKGMWLTLRTLFKKPVTASAAQIASFSRVFPNNFRPIQPLNRRFILLSK